MEIGLAILRSGGDVHRVEDSMTRICRAYGAVRVGVFAIPSLITAEVTMPDGETVSRMCRVESAYLHLCAAGGDQCAFARGLRRAGAARPRPRATDSHPQAAADSGMAVLCRRNAGSRRVYRICRRHVADGLCSAPIGAMIVLGQHHKLVRENINPMGITAVGSFLSGLLAVLCIVCGQGQNLTPSS